MENTLEKMAEQARLQRVRTESLIKGRQPHEDCVAAAKEYIRLNYEWQVARFGKVRQKYTVSYLLRALG